MIFVLLGCAGEADRDRPPPASPTPVVAAVRIGREEYANAVGDLLGVDRRRIVARLTPDDDLDGFATNTTAVTELQVEEYAELAEDLAQEAITDQAAFLECTRADRACAIETLDQLGRRAYRRPLGDEDRRRLVAVYDRAADHGFAEGLRSAIAYLLQSPSFLYRLERSVPEGRLDDFSVAARLASFLWRSVPDDALLAEAAAGHLGTKDRIEGVARDLLEDPRATDAIQRFHREWLSLDQIREVTKLPSVFAGYGADLRAAMLRETDTFVDEVVRADGDSLRTLLTATWSFADGPLLALYGVRPTGDDGRIDFAPGARSGILTHASVLSVHAHADQSSPVRRGLLVRAAFFCDPPPPPPPNVADTLPPASAEASTRARLAAHRSARSCERCHRSIDPIGYGFEAFDAVGRARTHDGPDQVDDEGEIVGTDVAGAFRGPAALGERLARSNQVRACIARKWFRFALGRPGTGPDAPSVRSAEKVLIETGNLRATILAIATSDAFRGIGSERR
jgi:hypothetical protein